MERMNTAGQRGADATALAALRLHNYLVRTHLKGGLLRGPDPGIRLNYRIGRFVKSYLDSFNWSDDLVYMQGQGYWMLANWRLYEMTGNEMYRSLASQAARRTIARQESGGWWAYPNPEWRGRVATAEGTWAALGLVQSYRYTGTEPFLRSALAWHDFVTREIGFQQVDGTLAVNYFAREGGARIPNNTAFYLRFLATLAAATGDHSYLEPAEALVAFLERAQLPSGELPYALPGTSPGRVMTHFQCFQYNAFICLDLASYASDTGDHRARSVAARILPFLMKGVSPRGEATYACDDDKRHVLYHAAALGAALGLGDELQVGPVIQAGKLAMAHVLDSQLPSGGFHYSRNDYGLLRDNRSYPRYLAMILLHLLQTQGEAGSVRTKGGETWRSQSLSNSW